jgi:aspartyl/asparaginyl-tRNA synthetase
MVNKLGSKKEFKKKISMSKEKRTNLKNLKTYHTLVQKMRDFFLQKGFIEVATQPNLTILSACENPHSVTKFDYVGQVWPLPQTGQMILEEVLLSNPELPGCFCISTSYRQEKDPIPGRHELLFAMFEFESKGTMTDMIKLESDLLGHLGFSSIVELNYDDVCQEYGGVEILENEHETRMWDEIGPVLSLQNFPLRTSPFFNMRQNKKTNLFNKVDVILYGQETIGSAERSCDVEEMRQMFYSISDGEYANKLFELFGKDRVEKELEEFLTHDFFPRFGGGIGMTRLARAYEMSQKDKLVKEVLEA